jgi:hypothetical protein
LQHRVESATRATADTMRLLDRNPNPIEHCNRMKISPLTRFSATC